MFARCTTAARSISAQTFARSASAKARGFSTAVGCRREASRILGLELASFTATQLRDAYYKAARAFHPDTFDGCPTEAGKLFIRATEAYELLGDVAEGVVEITESEDENYRAACLAWLGLDADTVEQSKKCPMFRKWLFVSGGEGAIWWRCFFANNGGLAPRLRPKQIAATATGRRRRSSAVRRRRRIAQG